MATKYPSETKNLAIKLRKQGLSLKEVSVSLGIAQSTSSLWLRNVQLNNKALARLKNRQIIGQHKSIQTRREQREKKILHFNKKAQKELSKVSNSKPLYKLLCSFLFWTEGGKSTDSHVYFINSEPKMVKTFMKLMRESFNLDETKFRALLHLHNYHKHKESKRYWSELTQIPQNQFSKTYNKPNTKKRIRPNYKGSIRIRYYDHRIALELRSFYNTFVKSFLGA